MKTAVRWPPGLHLLPLTPFNPRTSPSEVLVVVVSGRRACVGVRRVDALLVEVHVADLLRARGVLRRLVLPRSNEAREAQSNAAAGVDAGLPDAAWDGCALFVSFVPFKGVSLSVR